MEFISGLAGFIATVAIVCSVAAAIRPSWFKDKRTGVIPKRKEVVPGLLVAAAFFGALSYWSNPLDGTEDAGAEAKAGTEGRDADATAEAARRRDEIISLWSKISDENDCDNRDRIAAAIERGDHYEAYGQASRAREVCRVQHNSIRALGTPEDLPDDVEDKMDEALSTCADSYLAKQIAFDQMLKVLDGDARPSTVNAAKEANEFSDLATLQCAVEFMGAADAAGVPMEAFASS